MNIASSLLSEIYDVCTYVFIYHLASNYGVGFVYADTVATSMLRMYHKFLVRSYECRFNISLLNYLAIMYLCNIL